MTISAPSESILQRIVQLLARILIREQAPRLPVPQMWTRTIRLRMLSALVRSSAILRDPFLQLAVLRQ